MIDKETKRIIIKLLNSAKYNIENERPNLALSNIDALLNALD